MGRKSTSKFQLSLIASALLLFVSAAYLAYAASFTSSVTNPPTTAGIVQAGAANQLFNFSVTNNGGGNWTPAGETQALWQYKSQITINGSTSALTDYQIPINLTTALYNNTGLVGSWHFNEGTGNRTADSSGFGNDGTMYGNMNTTLDGNLSSGWVSAGKFGNALRFDGTDDYINAGNGSSLNFERTNPFSICAWIKPAKLYNYGDVFSKWSGGDNGYGYHFYTSADGELGFILSSGGITNDFVVYTPTNLISMAVWQYACVAYNGSSDVAGVSFYINGVSRSNVIIRNGLTQSILTTNNATIGGRGGTPPDQYFNGTIDEVRIYNRSLSAAEIAEQYQAGKSRLDYQDLRFTWLNTSSGAEQNVSFWMESDNQAWVKVPNVTASTVANTTLYMYYGNPSATYNNSLGGNSTFSFFDDFSGDLGKWTVTGNPVVDAGELKTGPTSPIGYNTNKVVSKITFSVPFIFEYSSRFSDSGANNFNGFGSGTATDGVAIHETGNAAPNQLRVYVDTGENIVGSFVLTKTPNKIVFSNPGYAAYYNNVLLQQSASWATLNNKYISFDEYSSTGWFDDVRVRAYASPEPNVLGITPVAGSISQVQITLPSGFNHIDNSNGTSAAGTNFAASYYSSWLYRKAITINGSTAEQANYQVLINLTNISGYPANNFDFSKANPQGNDTRFTWLNTTSGLEQNISFWIENWSASGSLGNATVWIKVPNVTASSVANTTVYMYYGASGVASKSNLTNVFGTSSGTNIPGCASGQACILTSNTTISTSETYGHPYIRINPGVILTISGRPTIVYFNSTTRFDIYGTINVTGVTTSTTGLYSGPAGGAGGVGGGSYCAGGSYGGGGGGSGDYGPCGGYSCGGGTSIGGAGGVAGSGGGQPGVSSGAYLFINVSILNIPSGGLINLTGTVGPTGGGSAGGSGGGGVLLVINTSKLILNGNINGTAGDGGAGTAMGGGGGGSLMKINYSSIMGVGVISVKAGNSPTSAQCGNGAGGTATLITPDGSQNVANSGITGGSLTNSTHVTGFIAGLEPSVLSVGGVEQVNGTMWSNTASSGIIANGTTQYFWLNASVPTTAGNYSFNITVLDTTGASNSTLVNVSVKSITLTETLNATVVNSGGSVKVSGQATLQPDGTAVTAANVSVYLDGVFQNNATTNSTGGYNNTFTALSSYGTHTVKVNLTNSDGIYGENTATFKVNDYPSVSIAVYNSTLSQAQPYYMGTLVRISANVSDRNGNSDISTVLLNLSWPNGTLNVSNAAMTNIAAIDANTSTYEYNYTLPSDTNTKGVWNITVWANDTNNWTNTSSSTFNATTCYWADNSNITVSSSVAMIGSCSFDNVTITGTGTITTVQGAWLNLTANNLTIFSGGKIDASGKGYSGTYGPGAGGSSGGPCCRGSAGGGYGGMGGNGYAEGDGLTGPSYGSILAPNDLGSGGGSGFSGTPGAGGGLIKLMVSNLLANNGTISADGTGNSGYSGSGSGGTVNINATAFAGAGSITANGGNSNNNGGGGGGGRIAIYYGTKTYAGTITAYGGGSSVHIGGAGTIYQKPSSQAYGDLTIDNNGNSGANTPVNSTADNLSFNTVTIRSGAKVSSALSNLTLNATTLAGNGAISMGANNLTLRVSNLSIGGGDISSSGNMNITVSGAFNPGGTVSATGGGTIRLWYGATSSDRCDNTNVTGTAYYYYAPWSNATAYRCVRAVVLDNPAVMDSANVTRTNYNTNESFYPYIRIREYNGTDYFNVSGSWTMDIYNSNGSVQNATGLSLTNASGSYSWRTVQKYNESGALNTYSFLANISGTTGVGMTNSSLANLYTYNTKQLNITYSVNDTIIYATESSLINGTIYREPEHAASAGTPVQGSVNSGTLTVTSWWNNSWLYRKAITINGSTAEQANYQVLINLTNISGYPANNFDFSKANPQGNDTRFTWLNTTSGLEQNISFWIENWSASGSLGNATIWVKVPNVTASSVANTTVYMYYGSPSATYNNSLGGNNTFAFFDDFSGSTIDLSKWGGDTNYAALSNGILTYGSGTATYYNITSIKTFPRPSVMETRARIPGAYTRLGFLTKVNDNEILYAYHTSTKYIWTTPGTSPQAYFDTTIYNNFRIARTPSSLNVAHFYTNLVEEANSPLSDSGVVSPISVGFVAYSNYIYSDWIFVRAYASPEPNVLSVGAQENSPAITNSTGAYSFTYSPNASVTSITSVNFTLNATDSDGITNTTRSPQGAIKVYPSINITASKAWANATYYNKGEGIKFGSALYANNSGVLQGAIARAYNPNFSTSYLDLSERGETFWNGTYQGSYTIQNTDNSGNWSTGSRLEANWETNLINATVYVNPFNIGTGTYRDSLFTTPRQNFTQAETIHIKVENTAGNPSKINATVTIKDALGNVASTQSVQDLAVGGIQDVTYSLSDTNTGLDAPLKPGYWIATISANNTAGDWAYRTVNFFVSPDWWVADSTASAFWEYRQRITLDNSLGIERANVSVRLNGSQLNASGVNLSRLNIGSIRIIDMGRNGTGANEIGGMRLNYTTNASGTFGASDYIIFNASITENSKKSYYIYYSENSMAAPLYGTFSGPFFPASLEQPAEPSALRVYNLVTSRGSYRYGETVYVNASVFSTHPGQTKINFYFLNNAGGIVDDLTVYNVLDPGLDRIFESASALPLSSSYGGYGIWAVRADVYDWLISNITPQDTKSLNFTVDEIRIPFTVSQTAFDAGTAITISGYGYRAATNETAGGANYSIARDGTIINISTTNSTGNFSYTYTEKTPGAHTITVSMNKTIGSATILGENSTTINVRSRADIIIQSQDTNRNPDDSPTFLVNVTRNYADVSQTIDLDFAINDTNGQTAYTIPRKTIIVPAEGSNSTTADWDIRGVAPQNYTIGVSANISGYVAGQNSTWFNRLNLTEALSTYNVNTFDNITLTGSVRYGPNGAVLNNEAVNITIAGPENYVYQAASNPSNYNYTFSVGTHGNYSVSVVSAGVQYKGYNITNFTVNYTANVSILADVTTMMANRNLTINITARNNDNASVSGLQTNITLLNSTGTEIRSLANITQDFGALQNKTNRTWWLTAGASEGIYYVRARAYYGGGLAGERNYTLNITNYTANLTIALNASTIKANRVLAINITTANGDTVSTAGLQTNLTLLDAAGSSLASLLNITQDYTALQNKTNTTTWAATTTAPGTYYVRARAYLGGTQVGEANQSFQINDTRNITQSVSTNASSYSGVGKSVGISAWVNRTGNVLINGTADIYIISYGGTRYEAELNDSGTWTTSVLNFTGILTQPIQARWDTQNFHNGTYFAYLAFNYTDEYGNNLSLTANNTFNISPQWSAAFAYVYPTITAYNWSDTFANVTIRINNTGNTELCDDPIECEFFVKAAAVDNAGRFKVFTVQTAPHDAGWTGIAGPVAVLATLDKTAYVTNFVFSGDSATWLAGNYTFNTTMHYDGARTADNLTYGFRILETYGNLTLAAGAGSNVNNKNFTSNSDLTFNADWSTAGANTDRQLTGWADIKYKGYSELLSQAAQNFTATSGGTPNNIVWNAGQMPAAEYDVNLWASAIGSNATVDFVYSTTPGYIQSYTRVFRISPTKDARVVSIAPDRSSNYSLNENATVSGTIWRRGNINFTGTLDINISGPSNELNMSSCDTSVSLNNSINASFSCAWNTSVYPAGTYNASALVIWGTDPLNRSANWTAFSITAVKSAAVTLSTEASSYSLNRNISPDISIAGSGNTNITGNLTLALTGTENKTLYSENAISISTSAAAARSIQWNITNTLAGNYILNATYAYYDANGNLTIASAAKSITVVSDSNATARIYADKQSYIDHDSANFTFNITAGGNREYSNLTYSVAINNSVGIIASSSWAPVARNATAHAGIVWNTATYPAGSYIAVLTVSGPSGESWTANTTFAIPEIKSARIRDIAVNKVLPQYYNPGESIAIQGGTVRELGNANFSGNLTVTFIDKRTLTVYNSTTCNNAMTPYSIPGCTGSSIGTAGWSVGRVYMNASFAYYNSSGQQLAVNTTEIQIGTTSVNASARGNDNIAKTDFFKKDSVKIYLKIRNTSGDTVSGIAAGNVSSVTENGVDITSAARGGWTDAGGGEYYFTLGELALGTYTIAAIIQDPYEGTSGTGSVTFVVTEHWVIFTVSSGGMSPVSDAAKNYAASDLPGSTATALISRGSLKNVSGTSGAIAVNQWLENNNIYLVFTKGTYTNIENRLPEVESGAFEKYASPSFGFPLKKEYTLSVGIDYSPKDINLLGDMQLYPGTYTFVIKNEGAQAGKTIVSVGRK